MTISKEDIEAFAETDEQKEFWDITDSNHIELLVILMEECAEVIQEASKLIRFPENDTDKLTKELGDLQFMINLTANQLDIDPVKIGVQANRKRKKLETYSSLFS
jgi:NTP pyrophosphatase (non-canonical NTP hydrolase)